MCYDESKSDLRVKLIMTFLVILAIIGGAFIGSAWGFSEPLPEPSEGITVKDVSGVVCTIPVDEEIYVYSRNFGEYMITSFEDQYVNVVQIWSKNGKPDVITFDIKGFIHNCPHHGREVIDRLTGWGYAELKKDNCRGLSE